MLSTEREGVNEASLFHVEHWGPRQRECNACGLRVLSASSPAEPGTRCSLSGSCPRIAHRSWAFRRRSPADSPVGALAHRGAPLGTTHSNCNGSKRRRSPADSPVRAALDLGTQLAATR